MEDLEESIWFALNRNLEICFQRHLENDGQISIKCRSSNFHVLISMLKEAVKKCDDAYRSLIDEVWISRLLDAAKRAGRVG